MLYRPSVLDEETGYEPNPLKPSVGRQKVFLVEPYNDGVSNKKELVWLRAPALPAVTD